jgi:hypothetical protein
MNNEEAMRSMLEAQVARAEASRKKTKPIVVVIPPVVGSGKIKVKYEIDPQDLRPSPLSRSAEDALGEDETGGEKRTDYDPLKGKR